MRSSVETWRGRVRGLLATDAVALTAAFAGAYALRTRVLAGWFTVVLQPGDQYVLPGAVVVVLGLAALAFGGMYEDRRYLSRLEEYAGLAKAVTYGLLGSMALAFPFQAAQYSRVVLALDWACAILLLGLTRFAWSRVIRSRRARGLDILRVAVLAAPGELGRVRAMLRRYPQLGYRAAAHLPIRGAQAAGNLRRLERWVASGAVEGVVLSVPAHRYELAVPYLAWCRERWVPFHRLTGIFDAFHAAADPGSPEGDRQPLYALAKRLFDEAVAVGLLVATAPAWLLIALAVKLDSPGPVLFVQERVGQHGKTFRLFKFRTMYASAPRYALTVRRSDDARVTPVGGFLRRTSLDELPQLLNVLRGEMSLVGPRPEMPFMASRNTLAYRRRLQVPPGLTGLWQAVARHEPLEESLRYDLYYIKHRSFAFDLVIIARTVFSVLSGRGAR